jgi:hypothetical protein
MKRDLNHEFGDDNADDGERVQPHFTPVTVNGVTYTYKNKERYHALRGAGLCTICGRAPATTPYCAPCRALNNAAVKRRYNLKKAMGKCVTCGGKPTPGKVLCSKCYRYVPKRKRKHK